MSEQSLAMPVVTAHEPRFLDTYALVYAFILAFLIPGLVAMSTMPFRTYTFQYVSVFAVPFVLGLIATFATDSTDRWRRVALRSAVLIPLVVMTGVTVLFTGSLTVLPVSPYLRPGNGAVTTPLAVALLVVLAAPLVVALIRRFRSPLDWRSVAQIVALVFALGVAAWIAHLMLSAPGELRGFARKDLTIYATGAVMWYLPSFGIAAGVWRSIGLV